MENKQSNITNTLILLGLVLLGLYLGKTLIIPFVIALVVWYLLNSLKKLVARIKLGGKQLPKFLQVLLSVTILGSILFFVGNMVMINFEEFVKNYPKYHESIIALSEKFNEKYDLPISIPELIEKMNFQTPLSDLLNSSLGFVGNTFLVIIYVSFLSVEERIFGKKLKRMFNERAKYLKFLTTMQEIDRSIHAYVSVKTGLCLLVAISSFFVLQIMGIDFAVLWAFVIFLFNYIPIVGPAISITFPVLIAVLQFTDGGINAIIVGIILFSIQLVVGNFVEPKVLGHRLNLSPLVVIIALVFWGALWGVAGMILCVPITVILMIVFSQFQQTKKIAILLSGGKSD